MARGVRMLDHPLEIGAFGQPSYSARRRPTNGASTEPGAIQMKGAATPTIGRPKPRTTKEHDMDESGRTHYGYMYDKDRQETYGRMVQRLGPKGYKWVISRLNVDTGTSTPIASGIESSEEAAKAALDRETHRRKMVS